MSRYFVVEGPDGAGKSTLIHGLATALTDMGKQVLTFRHPGSTPVGEEIRTLVKNRTDIQMARYTEQVLMAADYAEFLLNELPKNLNEEYICISDRSNLVSGMIYGLAGGVSNMQIEAIQGVTCNLISDMRMFVLSASYEALMERRHHDEAGECKFEMRGDPFHKRVAELYTELGDDSTFVGSRARMFAEDICMIDATNCQSVVLESALRSVLEALGD